MCVAGRTLDKRRYTINSESVRKAYEWAETERKDYDISIKELIRIVKADDYCDPNNASVSFFYDKESEKALCRVHWKSGEIRYDEVDNFNELLFKSNEFVTHLLTNGVKISKLYTALGY